MGLKVASLFSGIGAWEVALRDLGIEHELQFFSEIDKYAIKSYCAIHGETEEKNIGDITKLDDKAAAELPDIDILCYSPPCQAFSVAGNMKGFEDKRGILFFDAMRIIRAKKPKYALMENVKGLTTKKFKAEFGEMLKDLVDAGYTNYWMVLNTKNYGIPQNRERVFVISMLEDKGFNKPKEVHNGLVLRDMLEDEVDEKYYLSQDKVDKLIITLKEKKQKNEPTLFGGIGNQNYGKQFRQGNRVYDSENIAMCLLSQPVGNTGGNSYLYKVPIKNATKKGYELATENDSINISYPESKTRRGRVQKDRAGTLETGCNQGVIELPQILRYERTKYGKEIRKKYESGEIKEKIANMRVPMPRNDNISNTISTVIKDNYLITQEFRIRKLTPKESFRLQGFKDSDIDKCIEIGISNTQLYKQAGNSITVDVCKAIFKEIAKEFKLNDKDMEGFRL